LRRNGPSYFIKQIQNFDSQAIAMLQCESVCYWLARNDSQFISLIPLTPEFFFYDPERQMLITRLISNGEDLWEHFRRQGEVRSDVAQKLGSLLGAYHKNDTGAILKSSHNTIFPRQLPWILLSERRNSHPFKYLSRATAELFDQVERSRQLPEALDQIRNEWQTTTLMHGDLKLENCILSTDLVTNEISVTTVDWELADIGDPCWDTGSILQSFVSAKIMSYPITDASRDFLDQRVAVFESLRSFWQAYSQSLGITSESSEKLLKRCLRFGAARMIQSAYEYMQFLPQLSTNARFLVEMSESLLLNPTKAIEIILTAGNNYGRTAG